MCQVFLFMCDTCNNRKTHMVDLSHCAPVKKLLEHGDEVSSSFPIRQGLMWSPLEGCEGLLIHPDIRSAGCVAHPNLPVRPRDISRADFISGTNIGRRSRTRRIIAASNLSQSMSLDPAPEPAPDPPSNPASDRSSTATPEWIPNSTLPLPESPMNPSSLPDLTSDSASNATTRDDSVSDGPQQSQTLGTGIQERPGGLYTRTLGTGRIGPSNYEINVTVSHFSINWKKRDRVTDCCRLNH